VLIVTGAFARRTVEMDLAGLPPAQLEERSSGRGTITFGTSLGGYRAPPGWPTMGSYGLPPAFMSINDAARVYRIVQDAAAAARQG
jgi:hypothetical protein